MHRTGSEIARILASTRRCIPRDERNITASAATPCSDAWVGRWSNTSGHKIDRERIRIDEPIRTLGVYPVRVALHAGTEATIKVWVVAK